MGMLDDILNFTIPIAVTIFLVFIILYPFREPLGKAWNKIKEWKDGRESSEEELNIYKSINYE